MTPGLKTTEFVALIAGAFVTVTAAFTEPELKVAALYCFTAIACCYIAGRSYAKGNAAK